MSTPLVRPAAAGYSSSAAASAQPAALVQGKRSTKSKRKQSYDQWNCADLLDTSKAKKRVFVWEASGSYAEMAGTEFYEAPLTSPFAVMFHPATDPPGSERKGDPKRAILLDGIFRSVTNRFVDTMVLSSNVFRGRTYGASRGDVAERGLLIVPGNRTIDYTGDDGRFLLPHPSLMSDVVRKFAKDGHRDLIAECVKMNDTGNYMVPADSPIMHIIENNEEVIRKDWPGFSVRKLSTVDGKILLPPDYVEEAAEVFNKAIKTRMPHVDLTTATLRLKRFGKDWRDPVVPNGDQTQNDRLLNMHGSFFVQLELTYRLQVSSTSA